MNIKRRDFLRTTAVGAAGLGLMSVPSVSAFGKGILSGNTVNVALIGVRSMGWANLRDFLKVPGVVCTALCDVDQNELRRRTKDLTDMGLQAPKHYGDYRKLLEDKSIDAVIIGTPDHWHCLQTVDSLLAGKHVYVEKPLANSLAEIDIMLKAARKTGKHVQVGQQQRSGIHWKAAIDLVQSGKLGKIRQVKYWANFMYGAGQVPVPDGPAPEGVDYNTWLGPAPLKPFNKNRFHGSWRMFRDYGGGLMSDWGVHLIDMGLWAMNVTKAPLSVSASGGNFANRDRALEFPDTHYVHYDMGDYMMSWEHNGGVQTGPWGRNYGVAFIGTNGTLVADRSNWEVFPEWGGDAFKMEEIPMMKSDDSDHLRHVENFVDVVRNGGSLNAEIEIGYRAALYAHLGNIAYFTGEKLAYDPVKMKFTGSGSAGKLVKPVYRAPYKFPVL